MKNSLREIATPIAFAVSIAIAPQFSMASVSQDVAPQSAFAAAQAAQSERLVSAVVSITWSDGSPVVGAKVFDHSTNTLLGHTGADGTFHGTVQDGTLLRLVDPDYGVQQSFKRIQAPAAAMSTAAADADASSDNAPVVAMASEGWSL